jgi:hypothetical protein
VSAMYAAGTEVAAVGIDILLQNTQFNQQTI